MCVHVRNVATDKSLEIYEMERSITILAVVCFYSRILIRKLPQNCICIFRKVENEIKSYTRKKTDLKFNVPNFVPHNIYFF